MLTERFYKSGIHVRPGCPPELRIGGKGSSLGPIPLDTLHPTLHLPKVINSGGHNIGSYNNHAASDYAALRAYKRKGIVATQAKGPAVVAQVPTTCARAPACRAPLPTRPRASPPHAQAKPPPAQAQNARAGPPCATPHLSPTLRPSKAGPTSACTSLTLRHWARPLRVQRLNSPTRSLDRARSPASRQNSQGARRK